MLEQYAHNKEIIQVDGEAREVEYLLALVPMDCVDDITHAHRYNPRHPKEDHRDRLMHQIGTYGLIQPLVATFDKARGSSEHQVFLIDGRHRFHALLALDPDLHADVVARSKEGSQRRDVEALSDISKLREPKPEARASIQTYTPRWDIDEEGEPGSPMVPVKIYFKQDEVERIGMAVFLNKGQKKLAGGEEIDRIFDAFDKALQEDAQDHETPSEVRAAERVMKGRGTTDSTLVVLSRHVAAAMRDQESPWNILIGRWQGEALEEDDEVVRKKPLTAKNYLAFARELVTAGPMEEYDEDLREAEIHNLDRLGEVFSKKFGWPDDIPTPDNRYTATALLVRSFLITAVGSVLSKRHSEAGKPLLSTRSLSQAKWERITNDVDVIQGELTKQAKLRITFETKKKKLRDAERGTVKMSSPDRQALLIDVDELRGKLWSLDTIVATLETRITRVLG